MTRKEIKMIANVLRVARNRAILRGKWTPIEKQVQEVDCIIDDMAAELAHTNENFNRCQFVEACYK
jgi:hypothetical protein